MDGGRFLGVSILQNFPYLCPDDFEMKTLRDTYGSCRASIRFRRWSRKRYAAFCSVGRVVTIGCLDKGIAEASLRKQQGIIRPGTCLERGEEPESGTDSSGGGPDMHVEVRPLLDALLGMAVVTEAAVEEVPYLNKKNRQAYGPSASVCLFCWTKGAKLCWID